MDNTKTDRRKHKQYRAGYRCRGKLSEQNAICQGIKVKKMTAATS